jgi:hypothetical protein
MRAFWESSAIPHSHISTACYAHSTSFCTHPGRTQRIACTCARAESPLLVAFLSVRAPCNKTTHVKSSLLKTRQIASLKKNVFIITASDHKNKYEESLVKTKVNFPWPRAHHQFDSSCCMRKHNTLHLVFSETKGADSFDINTK